MLFARDAVYPATDRSRASQRSRGLQPAR